MSSEIQEPKRISTKKIGEGIFSVMIDGVEFQSQFSMTHARIELINRKTMRRIVIDDSQGPVLAIARIDLDLERKE